MDSTERAPSTQVPWRFHFFLGLLLSTLALAGVLTASLGWCIGGRFYWTVALAGVFGNATLGLLGTALAYLVLRRHPRLLMASLVAIFLLQTLATIASSEFILQRGAPIAPIDIRNGLDTGFIESQLGVLFSQNFGPYLALSIVIFAGCLALLGRLKTQGNRREILVVLSTLLAFTALSFVVHKTPRGKHALRPYNRLLGALVTTNHLNIIVGLEPAMLESPVSEASALASLNMLGLPIVHGPQGPCLAEDISDALGDPALQKAFRALSEQLRTRERPLSFLFILLESVGSEDIHILRGTAPEGLTPYLDSLVKDSQVVVGKRFFQAGQRTAAAMSSILCGVGAGPFGMAPLRDLPSLQLRCWSDLASEAGADLRFFYADKLSFDRYDGSLMDHGFRYLHTPQTEKRPRGSWGLSDQEIFKDVLQDLTKTSPELAPHAPRIRGLLTLSTHGPFDTPEDMPPEAQKKALNLARKGTNRATKQAHWVVVSYLDHALSHFIPTFFQKEQEQGRTPVVLMVGDHTSGNSAENPKHKDPLATSRIAPIWIFPQSIERTWLDPVQHALDARNWSQNDLPRMILTLLDGAGALQSLSPQARWHTMGGQASSTTFSLPPPFENATIWSIDTHARSRFIGPSNDILLEELAESPSTRKDMNSSTKTMDMPLGGLSWLLQNPKHIGPCTPPKTIQDAH